MSVSSALLRRFRRWTSTGRHPNLARWSRNAWRLEQLEDRTVPTVVDLTAGAGRLPGTINGAVYAWTDVDGQSTGSGTFDSFVRIQRNTTEQGYNYDAANLSAQFDEGNTATFNHLLQLKNLPLVEYNGELYYQFRLDIFESQGDTNELLSLDEVQIFLTPTAPGSNANNGDADAYNSVTRKLVIGATAYTAVYDMDVPPGITNPDNSYVLLDAGDNSGNGKG